MKISKILVLPLLAVLLSGCPEEKNYIPGPAISVSEPSENQSFDYLDTVNVRAEINYTGNISFISVAIVDENSAPVLPVQTFSPQTADFELDAKFVFDNISIESGRYNILLKANGGEEITKEWVALNYTAPERQLKSVLAITRAAVEGYKVNQWLPDNQIVVLFNIPGDFLRSTFNAESQILFTSGYKTGNLIAWEIESRQAIWSVPMVSSPPLPGFTAMYCDNNEVFVSTGEAFINGYSATGLNTFHSQQFENGYFTSIFRYKNQLIASFEPLNSSSSKLVIFNYPSGTAFRQLQFEGEVVAIDNYLDDKLLILVNHEGESLAYEYNQELNTMALLKIFPQGRIDKAAFSEQHEVFIAVDNGVYWYKPGIGSMVQYLELADVSDLKFEYISGKLFVASGKLIKVFQPPVVTPVAVVELADSISDIQFQYNK